MHYLHEVLAALEILSVPVAARPDISWRRIWLVRLEPESAPVEDFITFYPSEFVLPISPPNHFNPKTKLTFSLPIAGEVSLVVHDLQGRVVARLADGFHSAGMHQITFNASQLPSGVYFARLQVNGLSQTRKILLIK